MEQANTTSYKQIAKSTGIFGGSQFFIILIGIVRTKVLAVFLGTEGIGLVGLFQSVIDLVRSISGLGLSFSSVKDIAEANNTNDQKRIAQTVTVLHRWLWWTGILGLLLTILFSGQLSDYIFGDKSKVWQISLLSFCVLTSTISSGQIALLQGLRQIQKMAKASFYGALGGAVVAIIMYSILGVDGIIPALIAMSVIGLFFSWWFARSVKLEKVVMTARVVFNRGGNMVRLGLFTVVSGLLSTLTLFLIKSFIQNEGGIESVGLFQSVWSVSNLYIGAVLTSMAADFYPRLCGLNDNNLDFVRFSNEQTRFVLIISCPLIIGMLLVASPVLTIFYTSKFLIAVNLLRWQILGAFLKVLVWPIGFILLAKGKGFRFLIVEFVWVFVYYLSTRICWQYIGLNAAGVSYVIAYLVYLPLVYFMIKPLCKFRYETKNIILMLGFLFLTIAAFCISAYLNGWISYLCGGCTLVISVFWSGYEFNKIIPAKMWVSKLKSIFIKRIG